jgi:hypothetical protein
MMVEPAKRCGHDEHMPVYKEDLRMSSVLVRIKYPRFVGKCLRCGENVILYASFGHYIAGDW